MGVRLYPQTQDRATLEILAGVPAGTYDKLDAFEKKHDRRNATDFADRCRRSDARYQELYAPDNEDLRTLDHFITFGWGSFDGLGIAEDCAGSLDDPGQVATVLLGNGINADPALCGGLCWG